MEQKKLQLSDHFSTTALLRFAFPSIVMMIFTSIYGVVDGVFVSNIVGQTAFASVNLILPYCMIFGAVGSLFGIGGSALVSYIKGQGDIKKSNEVFSFLVYSMIVLSIVLCILAETFLPNVLDIMQAEGDLRYYAALYGRIYLATMPAFIMQYAFQALLVAAERPKLGLLFTVGAGISNMILDYLFIKVFAWGIAGAAIATCIGQLIAGIGPLLFFLFSKASPLRLGKTTFMWSSLWKCWSNGFSDFMTNIAMSTINILYNIQLMKYIGEYGVSAYGIIMYVSYTFVSFYLGYVTGVNPIIGYHQGAEHHDEVHGLFQKSIRLVAIASLTLTILAEAFAPQLAAVFSGYDATFFAVCLHALRLYSICYLFSGLNIFGAGFFAALNQGLIAGILSTLRVVVFQLLYLLLLPLLFGAEGIWYSIVLAEASIGIITFFTLRHYRTRFHY